MQESRLCERKKKERGWKKKDSPLGAERVPKTKRLPLSTGSKGERTRKQTAITCRRRYTKTEKQGKKKRDEKERDKKEKVPW